MKNRMLESRFRLAAVLLVALAACAPVQWTRNGLVAAEAEADYAYCRRAAQQEAWLQTWRRQFHEPPAVVRGRDGRIYYVERPFGDLGVTMFRELDLTNFCMRAKGYELTPAPGR